MNKLMSLLSSSLPSTLLALATTSLLAAPAWAVDSSRCPDVINTKAHVDRVYASSRYEKVPGWQEAQTALSSITDIESRLKLVNRKAESCVYKDNDGNGATLSTAIFLDEDAPNGRPVDQLILRFLLDRSSFVSFVPVKDYQTTGVTLYGTNPYPIKIKARLFIQQTGKYANIDLGMISVTAN